VFSKILIANRGEIAVRVIRACRELGVTSVAVYSELDRNALHVRLADEAYALGGQTAAESYLNTDKIIEVIDRSGAEAVHPGYGFLSENTDFARAITAHGVAFVGPPPEAIEIMGDKVSSRIAAEKAGVAGVPGTTQFLTDADEVIAFGNAHGWPVAIKAAFGGGGRGMRVVRSAEEAASAFESAQSEALKGFGRSECYVERYLEWPRHVEMQVFADTHGNCVWLGERDCSAQRRHQKLIEESPAPGLAPDVRESMGRAAVRVSRACGYVNAGTVEFLYEDGQFYFLEMNTRLQVEHPVTEMVTGVDLVEEQLRVAAGEPLSFTQESVRAGARGHAIEVRLNAENPAGGRFLPSPGPINRLQVPAGPGVRWDGGYDTGDEVSQFYDNLIGKLIVWAGDRDAAIARMRRALDELHVDGVATTKAAHVAILSHPDFAAATHSTKWVEERLDLSHLDAGTAVGAGAGAAGDGAGGGAAGAGKVRRDVEVEVNGRRYSVALWVPETAPVAAGNPGTRTAPGPARPRRAAGSHSASTIAGSGQVTVPMQGTITKVLVSVGDSVEAGQPVCVLEAMKMESNINADKDGTVTEVKVSPGQSVGTGDVVVVID